MSGAKSVLILPCLLAVGRAWAADGGDLRLLFTGDILLSRQVRHEIERTKRFPWEPLAHLFHQADWVAGNLEGAVGPAEDCTPEASASPCFDIPGALVPLLAKAGFRALGTANNHALDLGPGGRAATRQALIQAGLRVLSFEDSPVFVTAGGRTLGVIAVSTVPSRDGSRTEIPSTALRQKLRLASGLSDMVVVFVHWGSELLEWPDTQQRVAAAWLVRNGADLIVGHHPHVVQAAECVAGRPVFYSLGNHLFDQKYPAAKQGLIADCRLHGAELRCGGIPTMAPPGSAFPQLSQSVDGGATDALKACAVHLTGPGPVGEIFLRGRSIDLNGNSLYLIEGARAGARIWRSVAMPLVSVQVGKLAGSQGPDYVLALERRRSTIDGEDGLRPYVYEAGPKGLVARWRGSALAWPLLDAALLPGPDGLLCGLHRRDSFVVLQPDSAGVRTAVYRWNGFGFSGVEELAAVAACRAMFQAER
jgi:poly-gamma-glutamate synthesis protein (capsule biosynthesis protein)